MLTDLVLTRFEISPKLFEKYITYSYACIN